MGGAGLAVADRGTIVGRAGDASGRLPSLLSPLTFHPPAVLAGSRPQGAAGPPPAKQKDGDVHGLRLSPQTRARERSTRATMDNDRRNGLLAFCSSLDAFVRELGYHASDPVGEWVIPAPWIGPGNTMASRLHSYVWLITAAVDDFADRLCRLCAEGDPPDDDGVQALIMVAPFHPGALGEAKTWTYEFGPVYHNIMDDFLQTMDECRLREAVASSLLWQPRPPSGPRTSRAGPRLDPLTDRLGALGSLDSSHLKPLAASLVRTYGASMRLLGIIDAERLYQDAPVWVRLVHYQSVLASLLARTLVVEAMWPCYSNTWHF
jgi:hypothetical protein